MRALDVRVPCAARRCTRRGRYGRTWLTSATTLALSSCAAARSAEAEACWSSASASAPRVAAICCLTAASSPPTARTISDSIRSAVRGVSPPATPSRRDGDTPSSESAAQAPPASLAPADGADSAPFATAREAEGRRVGCGANGGEEVTAGPSGWPQWLASGEDSSGCGEAGCGAGPRLGEAHGRRAL